jgi:hypothetical protein
MQRFSHDHDHVHTLGQVVYLLAKSLTNQPLCPVTHHRTPNSPRHRYPKSSPAFDLTRRHQKHEMLRCNPYSNGLNPKKVLPTTKPLFSCKTPRNRKGCLRNGTHRKTSGHNLLLVGRGSETLAPLQATSAEDFLARSTGVTLSKTVCTKTALIMRLIRTFHDRFLKRGAESGMRHQDRQPGNSPPLLLRNPSQRSNDRDATPANRLPFPKTIK